MELNEVQKRLSLLVKAVDHMRYCQKEYFRFSRMAVNSLKKDWLIKAKNAEKAVDAMLMAESWVFAAKPEETDIKTEKS